MKENEKYRSGTDGEDPESHTVQEGRPEARERLSKEDGREDDQPARGGPCPIGEEEENEEEESHLVEKTEEEAMAAIQERQDEADQQAQTLRESGTQEQVQEGDPEPVIAIKGLRKAFKDHEVLRGVDLHVNKGENLVVLGKSGSGKSVLIKCLVGLEWPDEGIHKYFRGGSVVPEL